MWPPRPYLPHCIPINREDGRLLKWGGTRQANGLIRGEALLAQKIVRTKQGQRYVLALFGLHAELHIALLNAEHSVSAIALRKDGCFRTMVTNSPARFNGRYERFRIETLGFFLRKALSCRQSARRLACNSSSISKSKWTSTLHLQRGPKARLSPVNDPILHWVCPSIPR